MSAALQIFAAAWSASPRQAVLDIERQRAQQSQRGPHAHPASEPSGKRPTEGLAFYRKHTESILRRYLYASMQVGRAPSVLADPVGRGSQQRACLGVVGENMKNRRGAESGERHGTRPG